LLGGRDILLENEQVAQLGGVFNCCLIDLLGVFVKFSPLRTEGMLCDVRHIDGYDNVIFLYEVFDGSDAFEDFTPADWPTWARF